MGLLTYEFNTSAVQRYVTDKTKEEALKEEIAFLMNVLPKGTEFLDAVEDNSHWLRSSFDTYILTFGHPYFENGTKLELDYDEITYEDKGSIKEISVFLGLRYIKPYPINPMAHLDDVGAPVINACIGKIAETIRLECDGLIGYQAYPCTTGIDAITGFPIEKEEKDE